MGLRWPICLAIAPDPAGKNMRRRMLLRNGWRIYGSFLKFCMRLTLMYAPSFELCKLPVPSNFINLGNCINHTTRLAGAVTFQLTHPHVRRSTVGRGYVVGKLDWYRKASNGLTAWSVGAYLPVRVHIFVKKKLLPCWRAHDLVWLSTFEFWTLCTKQIFVLRFIFNTRKNGRPGNSYWAASGDIITG